MNKKTIAALDFSTREEVLNFLKQFDEPISVKIGMELTYSLGFDIIREVRALGHSIFLDLKLHDIPNTVKKAMKNLAALDVDIVNLHCAGGIAMMKAAIEGLQEGAVNGKRPLCIGVTQLTSTSKEAMNAIHAACGDDFLTVTPGIRLADDSKDDQKRVATPAFAKAEGCDYIVVGRSITKSADPAKTYREIEAMMR